MIGKTFMLHASDRFLSFVVGGIPLPKLSENRILVFAQEIGASVGLLEFDIFMTEFVVLFSLQSVLHY